jgi:oligopeptide transport system substrate-binding protein
VTAAGGGDQGNDGREATDEPSEGEATGRPLQPDEAPGPDDLTRPAAGRTGARRLRFVAVALLATVLVIGAIIGRPIGVRVPGAVAPVSRGASDEVRIAGVELANFDPALSGDIASGAILANLYEGLTAFDPQLAVRPALARSWDVDPQWRHIVFHLRDGLTFSDGTPLGPQDVVRSWLRVLNPQHPGPLAGLLSDVEGVPEYLSGAGDASKVAITALPGAVDVRFWRSAPWFIAATASPALAVVPPGLDPAGASARPGSFVGSGAYVVKAVDGTGMTLSANAHYWAGTPPIASVRVVADLGQENTISAFRDGTLDYTEIPDFEARWIRYDKVLGPALRTEPSMTVEFFGFDTTRPPFSDVRVRQAFAMAVDWRGLAAAAGGSEEPANSLVPPGIPGRSNLDLLPAYDPAQARALLAQAGFPGGAGFPDVALQTGGSAYDQAVNAAIGRELGVHLRDEILGDFLDRMLGTDRPPMWALSWIADYPDPNDFLGVLLGGDQVSNFGRWKNADFDAALDRAAAAATPAERARAYEDAERIVEADVPIVPVAYRPTWALSRDGLLGAATGGIGIVRYADLAWSGK